MTGEKKKCRQYSTEYLKYGFVTSPGKSQVPFCLLCEKTVSNEAIKPSRLNEHFAKMHSDKVGKPIAFFQDLKSKFERRSTVGGMFKKSLLDVDKGLLCSYKVSLLIAKCGKPHTIGETLILPAGKEIINTMQPGSKKITQSIPLSNNTVSRRIDEMAAQIEEPLFDELRNTEFVIQIDESTVRDSEALLLGYVRFINKNDEFEEELLFARTLTADTKGSSIFKKMEEFFTEKSIPLANIRACATDGAASMVGRYRGFIAHLKAAVPGVLTVHCVVHRQHLVAKNLSGELHDCLNLVIQAVNKIKAHSLNDRLFRKLFDENDEEFERLLHTGVRWLSKGKCLRRFLQLSETAVEFLRTIDPSLSSALNERHLHVAYLAHVFDKLNENNTKLKGDKINFIKAKGIISAFIEKLDLFKTNLSRRELYQFPSLQKFLDEGKLIDKDLRIFCSHLTQLKDDMQSRFQDLRELEIPHWVTNPFLAETKDLPPNFQQQVIDLKHDHEAQSSFRELGYESF